MDGHIAHLHTRYRVVGAASDANLVAARLDRLAQTHLADALSDAMDQALGGDDAVFVIRHAHARLTLRFDNAIPDGQIVRRWAEYLAGAAMRQITAGPASASDLVRFEDQADYVAHFIVDLLQGRVARCWFYGAFTPYQSGDIASTVRDVLLAHREHLSAILRYLHQRHALESLIAALDGATLRSIVHAGLNADTDFSRPAVRALFFKAWDLVERLELWHTTPVAASLFQAYLNAGPAPTDWQDRQALSRAVLDVLRFLADQGYLDRRPDLAADAFQQRLEGVLIEFDWLDTDELRTGLEALLSRPALPSHSATDRPQLPLRPLSDPTPRQRELLDALMGMLHQQSPSLDRNHTADGLHVADTLHVADANTLRLYTALIVHSPRWADNPLAISIIQRLVRAWVWVMRCPSSGLAMQKLKRGNLESVLAMLPEGDQREAERALKALLALGGAGWRIINLLLNISPPPRPNNETLSGLPLGNQGPNAPYISERSPMSPALGPGIETQCAGVYLLLRAVMDARLPWLIKHAQYPPGDYALSLFLLTLALRWAGEAGMENERVEVGLRPLSDLQPPLSLDTLREGWAADATNPAHFQAALLRILAGQRAVRGDRLHLYGISLRENQRILVVGDAPAQIWPLGCLASDTTPMTETVDEWLETWQAATGQRPTLVAAASLAQSLGLSHKPISELLIVSDEDHNETPLIHAHRAGRDALQATLTALDKNQLGIPEVDLTVALTATALLRLWARWLRQFASSSVPYLLNNFIRRPGRVTLDDETIVVELAPRPLDIVMEIAGYTAAIACVPWLGQRRMIFKLRG